MMMQKKNWRIKLNSIVHDNNKSLEETLHACTERGMNRSCWMGIIIYS